MLRTGQSQDTSKSDHTQEVQDTQNADHPTKVSDDKSYGILEAALYRLVQENKINNVQTYLRKGVKTDFADKEGNTPLHIAARKDKHMVALLLEHAADRTQKNNDGYTPIAVAAMNGKRDCIREFTKYKDSEGAAEYGAALNFVVYCNDILLTEALFAAGAKTTWVHTSSKENPHLLLHAAVNQCNPTMLALLLMNSAENEKNKVNIKGVNPVSLAIDLASRNQDLAKKELYAQCIDLFSYKPEDPELELIYIRNRLLIEIDNYLENSMIRHRERALSFKQDCLKQTEMKGLTKLLEEQKNYLSPSQQVAKLSSVEKTLQVVEKKSAPHQRPSKSCTQDEFIVIIDKYYQIVKDKLPFVMDLEKPLQIVGGSIEQMSKHSAPVYFIAPPAPVSSPTVVTPSAPSVALMQIPAPLSVVNNNQQTELYSHIISTDTPIKESVGQSERDKTSAANLPAYSVTNTVHKEGEEPIATHTKKLNHQLVLS